MGPVGLWLGHYVVEGRREVSSIARRTYHNPSVQQLGTVHHLTEGFSGTVPDFSPTFGGPIGPGCETLTFVDANGVTQERTECRISP